jgi:hypothetical protein
MASDADYRTHPMILNERQPKFKNTFFGGSLVKHKSVLKDPTPQETDVSINQE